MRRELRADRVHRDRVSCNVMHKQHEACGLWWRRLEENRANRRLTEEIEGRVQLRVEGSAPAARVLAHGEGHHEAVLGKDQLAEARAALRGARESEVRACVATLAYSEMAGCTCFASARE